MESSPDGTGPKQLGEREQNWQTIASQVEQITDRLGKGVDERIKDLVVGLNVHQINTVQSCEGHLDWGTGAPWVDIESSDLGELEQLLRETHKIADESERLHIPPDEVEQLNERATTLQRDIVQRNLKERGKVMDLLHTFYQDRRVPYERQLSLQSYGLGRTRLESHGAVLQQIAAPEQKLQKLQEYQEEMTAFARFLRDKYFGEKQGEQTATPVAEP